MYFCRTILCWWFTINIDTHSWIMHGRDQFKRWEMEVKCQTTSLLKFWTGEARNWFVGRGGWEMRMFSSHCLGYIESSQNKTAPRHEVHFAVWIKFYFGKYLKSPLPKQSMMRRSAKIRRTQLSDNFRYCIGRLTACQQEKYVFWKVFFVCFYFWIYLSEFSITLHYITTCILWLIKVFKN